MDRIKVVSLFCGCGGTDVAVLGGFEFQDKYYDELHTELVYANDNEKTACDIFDENFEIKADRRDIKEIDAIEIPDCDLLIGGFPCQSFSVVAQNPKRLGVADDKGKLFFEMCRIIRIKQPKVFIAENVKGILSANKGEAFPLIIDEFTKCGYKVSFQIVHAAEYGVPQKRERVIIVGVRNDIDKTFSFPKPVLESSEFVPLKTVLEKSVEEKYFFSDRAVQGMLKSRKRMNKGRAQNPDEACNTVGAHLAKVSLNSTDPVLLENNRYRRFTPREVARIQSFPESFKLVGSEGAQYRALGNAIPPVMFWYIAKSVEAFFRALSEDSLS